MQVITVVGARPQFIKCASVSRAVRRYGDEGIIDTGQHYDDNMNGAFFRDLGIPSPRYRLGVGSGTHAEQTAAMLLGIERILATATPDVVLVYGDTNSTLAGTLAAAKLGIPVAHVEAGLRSFNRAMPEEINRIVTDHLSSLLFCPTEVSVSNLQAEGIHSGVTLVGDVMFDAVTNNRAIARERSNIAQELSLEGQAFVVATVHRADNSSGERLDSIVAALGELSLEYTVVWPMHPRTKKAYLSQPGLRQSARDVVITEPLPYLDMLWLVEHAAAVLTDSGGLQKEAAWLGSPCVTLRDETEWVETVTSGYNRLAGADTSSIILHTHAALAADRRRMPSLLGGASASERIARALADTFGHRK